MLLLIYRKLFWLWFLLITILLNIQRIESRVIYSVLC